MTAPEGPSSPSDEAESFPRLVCQECGATYAGHAEYCNFCGSEAFERRGGRPPAVPGLRRDGTVLVVQGSLWLVALVYLLGERGLHHPVDVASAWAVAALASFVAGLVTQHVRAALVFSLLGAAFFALTAAIRA